MKILILGHGEHGKTDLADMLASRLNFSYWDSSMAACEKAVYPVLKDRYGYASIEECYNDRRNHRGEWADLMEKYNNPPYRLASEILAVSSAYVGMRRQRELNACNEIGLFDYIIAVDGFDRMPAEGSDSIDIDVLKEAHYIVDNNRGLFELAEEADWLAKQLYRQFLKPRD